MGAKSSSFFGPRSSFPTLSSHKARHKQKVKKMKRQTLKNKKTYQKMPSEENIPRKKLPKVVQNHLQAYIEAGLIKQTRRGFYMKTEDEAVSETETAQPAWVDAAEEAVAEDAPEPTSEGDMPASALTVFTLGIGNRAAAIVQMCDALASGTAGLSVLQDIKGQAIMVLADLNLLSGPEETDSEESS